MWPVCLAEGILRGQKSLRCASVPFSFRIALKRVRHGYRSIAEVLSVHSFDTGVGCIEGSKVYERETFGISRLRISHYLWGLQNYAKGAESIVQQFFVHLGIQVTDKYVGADVEILLMGTGFVYSNRFTVKFDHIHDFNGIIRILLSHEFYETITLMHLRHPVFWHVYVYCNIDAH